MPGPVSASAPPASWFDLAGRLAVVTGCRRGIGLAMTTALAAAGADIVGVSAQLEHNGSQVADAGGSTGPPVHSDLHGSQRSGRPATADRASWLALERPIDILIANAGTIARGPAVDHSDDEWDRVVEVNLSSQFRLAREIGRGMVGRRSGKIVFTASLLSFQGGINVVRLHGREVRSGRPRPGRWPTSGHHRAST